MLTWLFANLSLFILFEVANLACSLSTNEDGTKIVQMAANHMETLCPQVGLVHFIPAAVHSPYTAVFVTQMLCSFGLSSHSIYTAQCSKWRPNDKCKHLDNLFIFCG